MLCKRGEGWADIFTRKGSERRRQAQVKGPQKSTPLCCTVSVYIWVACCGFSVWLLSCLCPGIRLARDIQRPSEKVKLHLFLSDYCEHCVGTQGRDTGRTVKSSLVTRASRCLCFLCPASFMWILSCSCFLHNTEEEQIFAQVNNLINAPIDCFWSITSIFAVGCQTLYTRWFSFGIQPITVNKCWCHLFGPSFGSRCT